MIKLLTLFVVLPLIELILLLRIGIWIGFLPTVGSVILTGILGAFLAKRQGLRVLNEVRRELHQAKIPADSLLNGAFVLIAGALLLTPGVLTDILGFSLLCTPFWPFLRRIVKKRAKHWFIQGSIRIDQGWQQPKDNQPGQQKDDFIDV